MPSNNTAATEKALRLVDGGMSKVDAARRARISLSTLYRALKRRSVKTP